MPQISSLTLAEQIQLLIALSLAIVGCLTVLSQYRQLRRLRTENRDIQRRLERYNRDVI